MNGAHPTKIGVIGDFDRRKPTHLSTSAALENLVGPDGYEWVGTAEIDARWDDAVRFRGLLIAPGSPYRDMEAVLRLIRHAREEGVPLVGT